MDSQDHVRRGRALRYWLLALASALVLVLGLTSVAVAASPPMNKWTDSLPVPPVATKSFNPAVSWWADYYEINMTASQHTFNSAMGPATVWTYGQPGKTPVLLGPTIVATSGRPVVIKWINNLPTALKDFPLKDSIDPTIAGSPGFGLGQVAPRSGDSSPPRRAYSGALRWDPHAVVDSRRQEG